MNGPDKNRTLTVREARLKLVAEHRLDGRHIVLPVRLKCETCKEYGTLCLLRRTIMFPNSGAGLRCACCKTDDCSFLEDNDRQRAPLQKWLDNNSAHSDVLSPQQPTVADSSPVPSTASSARRIKLVTKAPPITPQSLASPPQIHSESESDSCSLSTAPSNPSDSDTHSPPAASTGGEGSHSKRPRSDGNSSNDETPTAKAARLDTASSRDNISAGGLSNSDFDQHLRGLVAYRQTVRKRNDELEAAKTALEKEVGHMQKLHQDWQMEVAGLDEWNNLVVRERDAALAAVKLATEREEEMEAEAVNFRAENDKLKEDVKDAQVRSGKMILKVTRMSEQALNLEKERDAGLRVIADLKSEVKKIQDDTTERDAAVRNANDARLQRQEAQNALADVQTERDRLIGELETMTNDREGVMIDLENTESSLERAQADAADLVIVRAELDTARSEAQRLLAVNDELAASVQKVDQLNQKLDARQIIAKDMLNERTKMEFDLGEARTEVGTWRQKAKEYKWDLHLAQNNLNKSEKRIKELERGNKKVKRESDVDGGPSLDRGEGAAANPIIIPDDGDN